MIARRLLWISLALTTAFATHAQSMGAFNPDKLPPLSQEPLKLLATTALSGKGQDYFTLKPKTQAVVGTITGPAVILRVWSTSSNSAMVSLDMTIDGKKQTLYEKGKPVGLATDDPLRAMDKQAYWSYLPLAVKQKAVFTARSVDPTADIKFYLQVGYRQASTDDLKLLDGRTVDAMRSTVGKIMAGKMELAPDQAAWRPEHGGHDFAMVRKEATLRLGGLDRNGGMTVDGPNFWWLQLALPADATIGQVQATRLILTCDGNKTVDVPLGALFGQYWQLADYESAGTSVEGRKLLLRFPIPVAKTLTVSLANNGRGALRQADITLLSAGLPTAPKYHFCAQYFSQVSVRDQSLQLLNVTGPGLFVGSNLAVDGGTEHKTFAFLEGNEQIYLDGATAPTLEGTGTEDYFNNSWYFETGQLARPFHGVTFIQPKDPPRVVAYRWMIPDCIPFKSSFRYDLQHGSHNTAPGVLYRGVMFWYQEGQVNVSEPVEAKLPSGRTTSGPTKPGPEVTASHYSGWAFPLGGVLIFVCVFIAVLVALHRRRRGR